MPDCSVGCEAHDTTSPLPPPDGVWNKKTVAPSVIPYHVFADHDEA